MSIEVSFDYVDGKHIPTVKISLPPCEVDDSSAWDSRDEIAKKIEAMLAAAPVPPAGGEVEVQRYASEIYFNGGNAYVRYEKSERGSLVFHGDYTAHVTRLQAEVERLNSMLDEENDRVHIAIDMQQKAIRGRDRLQSRLAQATAIIDYLWLHTELDAIAKSDIDKFYTGSTDAEKAARAEMVRVANEPAGEYRVPYHDIIGGR